MKLSECTRTSLSIQTMTLTLTKKTSHQPISTKCLPTCHCYYSGLAEWIKDVIGQQGKPTALDTLKTLAHSIDACQWEWLCEKSHSGADKSKTDNKSNKSKSNNQSSPNNNSNANNSNNSNSNNSNSNTKKNNNNNKSSKLSSSGNSVSPDKLGKDSKLTPQKHQWWFNNNLCMFCGGVGYTANNCTKPGSSTSKAKACSAQATEKSCGSTMEKTKSSDLKKAWAVLRPPHRMRTALPLPVHSRR